MKKGYLVLIGATLLSHSVFAQTIANFDLIRWTLGQDKVVQQLANRVVSNMSVEQKQVSASLRHHFIRVSTNSPGGNVSVTNPPCFHTIEVHSKTTTHAPALGLVDIQTVCAAPAPAPSPLRSR